MTRTRPDESMSLLTDLFSTAVDDEYFDAAARRRSAPVDGRPVPPSDEPARPAGWRTPSIRTSALLAAGIAVLSLLLVTTAIQAHRSAPALAAERQSLIERIDSVRNRSLGLRADLTAAEDSLAAAQDAALESSDEGEAIRTDLDRLELVTGATPVVGPGIVIILDDAQGESDEGASGGIANGRIQDIDVRQLLNGLWSAGAEAISVDGTRVTSRTSVRAAGDALFVDLVPLRPPYEVRAIGDPDTLAPRFLDSYGATWLQTLAGTYGIRFDVNTESSIEVPAVSGFELEWAQTKPGGGP